MVYKRNKYAMVIIDYIYNEIDDEIIEQCPDFDALFIKYFIAKTKEGIQK